jgi:hypothetical protein
MPVRAANGVLRTDPIETPIEQRAMATTEEEDPWRDWNAWMGGHKSLLKKEVLDTVSEAIGMLYADIRKQLTKLELQHAETRGAIDILRAKGAPGAFNVKGTFDSTAVYNHHDVVMHGGSSWVALQDTPGALPGPGWRLLACSGKRGARGEPGKSAIYACELEGDQLILRAIGSTAPLRVNLRPLIERVIAETRNG